jgi:hypothetical protein
MTALRNAPAVFVAGFWRDFYRAMLTQATRKAVSKWLGLCLCLLLVGASRMLAQARTDLVVALDLSTSEAFQGRDRETQLEKNVRGVERLLASINANSQVTVIGITQNSFADPYIILRAGVSSDPGYFGEHCPAADHSSVARAVVTARGHRQRHGPIGRSPFRQRTVPHGASAEPEDSLSLFRHASRDPRPEPGDNTHASGGIDSGDRPAEAIAHRPAKDHGLRLGGQRRWKPGCGAGEPQELLGNVLSESRGQARRILDAVRSPQDWVLRVFISR